MSVAPFPTDPVRTAISIAYRNPSYIADGVLPRTPVSAQQFKWWKYPIEETFALPSTKVGRKSRPNEIDLTATEEQSKVDDYGLEEPIPQSDIDNSPKGYDTIDHGAMQLTEYIQLDREKRTADLVFNAANYPSGNKVTLSGNDQWSAAHADSDPIADITAGLAAALIRPNVMVMGEEVWLKLQQHPKIVKAIHGNEGETGIVARKQVAALFELEEVLVGLARVNTAKKGQTATIARVWGKHCLLAHRNKLANTQRGITFGFTAEFGTRVAGKRPDPDIGLRGGVRVRVGESVKELIVAGQAAYFIQDAVA